MEREANAYREERLTASLKEIEYIQCIRHNGTKNHSETERTDSRAKGQVIAIDLSASQWIGHGIKKAAPRRA